MIKHVTKPDGRIVPFSKEKIAETCIRIGVEPKKARQIADWVQRTAPDRSSTRDIYEMVLKRIEQVSEKAGGKFRLREGIADMDPESFELYSSKILEMHGWKTVWNKVLDGASVDHQVDVIASKGKETWLIECKRHFNPHRWTGLGVMLQVQARLEDLQAGYAEKKKTQHYNFTGAWIWTNTKFSNHAKQYAKAKDIRLTGWRSGEHGLEKLVEAVKAFPVTLLKVDTATKSRLLEARLITLKDIVMARRGPVPNWRAIVNKAKVMLQ